MRHDRTAERSILRNLWAAAQIAGHVLAPWRRSWRTEWGRRSGESVADLPGEDLIPDPTWQYTHAISIDAPAERVWPWIVQLGQGRAGFYSFERLENLVGCRIANADEIRADLQDLSVGDGIRLHPSAPALTVAVVEAGRSLVLRGSPIDQPSAATDNLWGFHLVSDGPGRCRLIERGKTVHGSTLSDRLFFSDLLVEPIGFVMSREMLLGIRDRAEGG